MTTQKDKEIEKLLIKYKNKLQRKLNVDLDKVISHPISSKEYLDFKKDNLPKHLSTYEKLCKFSEKLLRIKPDKKKIPDLQEAINICHLNMTPTGAMSFAILFPMLIAFFGSIFSFLLLQSFFFVFFFILVGLILIVPFSKIPLFLANNWRMKASNQMVLCIFYVVTYMRHTSNLENAINFAAEHLSPPLAFDLKKVLWDVETEKYESIKESLDIYLETWRKWNIEFIEAFHLVESSLFESSESRRIGLLDKSLSVMLTETYEKMLHYAHNLKSPITMLHMLGIILPILGLVILPLVVSFMENVEWYHISMLYNILLPIGVYYLGKTILSKRPTGYGDTDISRDNPGLKKYKSVIVNLSGIEIKINPIFISIFVFIIILMIGLSPLIMHFLNPNFDMNIVTNDFKLLEYKESIKTKEIIGPYGLGASILGLAIPLSIGLSLGLYYKLRSNNIIRIRKRAKELEKEFASGIFQLGNRIGDGLPAEIAFGKVGAIMEGTVSGSFFNLVSQNIVRLGMSVKNAIFNPKQGALTAFPSNLIESSMKVLVEGIKKGPKVAAAALMSISRYIKEIHKVNERLKDLMADIISSMKSQIKFLTPVIAGIVIGITSMITTILGKLATQVTALSSKAAGTQIGAPSLGGMFGDGIPTYFFQLIVGLYVVQIIYILTILVNGIENGSDKLSEKYNLGKNLINGTVLYTIISLAVIILFNLLAMTIMKSINV